MPRYFFNVRSDTTLEVDSTGLDFASLDEAVADAKRARIELLADEALEPNVLKSGRSFEITDLSGELLATVGFADP